MRIIKLSLLFVTLYCDGGHIALARVCQTPVYTVTIILHRIGGMTMRRIMIIGLAAAGLLLAAHAQAVTIVQCEDADGNKTYQEKCPPGTTAVETKDFYTGPKATAPDMESLKENKPVVLYSVETCDACDLVRNYLNTRGTPFNEKPVGDNAELQEELIDITGELSVPVVTIGQETVEGYNKAQIKDKLDQAGYPDNSEQASEQESTGT